MARSSIASPSSVIRLEQNSNISGKPVASRAPIDIRSFISVVSDTFQPSPTAPSRWLIRNHDVGEIDLVEFLHAVGLLDRPHLDAFALHVEEEHRQALVLGHVGIGAGDQQAVVGIMRARGPDLLAVDDPVVAVLFGAGAQARDVGAAGGLREQLAPDLLAGGELRQIMPLVLPRCHRPSRSARTCPRRSGTAASACRRRPLPAARSRVSIGVAPRPPYSFGQCRQAQPPSAFFFCQALPTSTMSCFCRRMRPSEDFESSASNSFGALASIHLRAVGAEFGFLRRVIEVHGDFLFAVIPGHASAGTRNLDIQSLDSGFEASPRPGMTSPSCVPWSVSC